MTIATSTEDLRGAGSGVPGPFSAPKLTHQASIESIIKDKSSLKLINALSLQLRRGQLSGPEAVSEATAKTLRSVVSAAKYDSMQGLIDIIKSAGRQLQMAQPNEQSIGNITRRVVHLLREEAKAALLEAQEKEHGGRATAGSNSLSNSLADLRISSALAAASANTSITPSSSSNATTTLSSANHSRVASQSQPSHSQQSSQHQHAPSSSSSSSSSTTNAPASNNITLLGAQPLSRPGPYPLRSVSAHGHAGEGSSSSAFMHGSFSISDLVAAGAMAATSSTSSIIHTPADSSYASTPHASLSRKGSGIFDSNLTQLTQHLSQSSVTEDPDGEAQAEADDIEADSDGSNEDHDTDAEDNDDDDEDDLVVGEKKSKGVYFLKPLLIQAIQDLIDELETVDDNIAKVSKDHIHSGEVILTFGSSATVESFFKAAAKDRKFTVIVPEAAPFYAGHVLARSLSQANISVLLIPDSCVFGVMPRVSKVVLGAHAVLANGGLHATAGSLTTALAAKHHSVPVVIATGVYKICPEWSSVETFRDNYADGPPPQSVLDFSCSSNVVENTEVVSNHFDYIPPNLVDVFITNVGEHPPSYVYRLVKENYHQDDIIL